MTNRYRLIATAIALLSLAAGAGTAHTVTASPCRTGWAQVQGPAACELEGSN
jgi:hypothetical protein